MANIFVAHTPYNILTSYSIASDLHDNSILLLSPSFKNAGDVYSYLKTDAEYFDRVTLLPRRHPDESSYGVFTPSLRVIKTIVELNGVDVDHLYFCKDLSPVAQAAKFITRTSVKSSWVVDGTSGFIPISDSRTSAKNIIKNKARYGPWFKSKEAVGTTDLFEEVISIYPEHLQEDLKSKNTMGISKESFESNRKWIKPYVSNSNLDTGTLTTIDALITLEHSSWVGRNSNYAELIRRVIEGFRDGLNVGIKYHPREREEYMNLTNNINIIPQEYPSEFIYLLNDSIEYVVGGVSTSLMTAQWLLDDSTVISYLPELNTNHNRLSEVFDLIGIDLLSADHMDL